MDRRFPISDLDFRPLKFRCTKDKEGEEDLPQIDSFGSQALPQDLQPIRYFGELNDFG